MKSYDTFVMALYGGICEDATTWWPDTRSSMELDLSYLRRALEQRGLSFFTITLPDFGHWIDRSLDQTRLLDSADIPRGIPLYRGRPRLFWGILAKVFDYSGSLRSDADHGAVLILRTLCQSLKKLELPVTPLALKKTVKDFFDVEEHLPSSRPDTWDCEIPIWPRSTGHPLWGTPVVDGCQADLFPGSLSHDPRIPWDTLRQLCRRVTSEIGEPDFDHLRPKHGPGVTSETGWGSKYEFPNWSRRLESVFPFDWFGSGQLDPDFEPDRREIPSRLIAVPKTRKGPRLICAEPLANQWMQQSIWRWLEGRVESTVLGRSISFRSQEESQQAALLASHDGSSATLDLSAASDRLSTRLVDYVFQGNNPLLDMIHACRTQIVEQTLDSRFQRLTVLRKFATMGSALTFPVQTIIFTILTVWALRLYEGREDNWKNWKEDFDRVRVFGDDIICPRESYGLTKFVLHECGLLVNSQKSFGGLGAFRESCGMDAFRGVCVTPARSKVPYSGSASSTAALVEYTNNLYKKGMWHASARVLSQLPNSERKLLLVGGQDDRRLGLLSFQKHCPIDPRRIRWDEALQREYTSTLAFISNAKVGGGQGRASLTQFFTEDPGGRNYRFSHDRNCDWHVAVPTYLFSEGGLSSFVSGKTSITRLRKQRIRVYL